MAKRIATIKANAGDHRIDLSIAYDEVIDKYRLVSLDADEDTGNCFNSVDEAMSEILWLYGSPEWDLQVNF